MRYFEVGVIANTHGVKGLVKALSYSDDPDKFFKLNSVLIDGKEIEIERATSNKQFILLKLKGINDMNAALAIKGKILKIPESDAIELSEGEYYIRDIYDMEVYEGEEFLGVIADILFTGANDVYVVKKDGEKDLLIPAIKSCILDVNVPEKRMSVHLLEGLRSL